ncbi:MAG: hypothetical protein IKL07_05540 [Clostridium sp.]|nr:hypothetical protein [Clostridium sp.]
MIHIFDRNYYHYSGRIVAKNNSVYLGYTNSSVEFYVKGEENETTRITAEIGSNVDIQPDFARLRVYVDDVVATQEPIVLDELVKSYDIASFSDGKTHKISVIKITEAQMSNAELRNFYIEHGTLLHLPSEPDTRKKVEFIGDSITCGYGVLGSPHSEFHIREEDGELSYAALTAKELNLNARYTAVSGYGVYCEYTGNLAGTLPNVYPYINKWVDPDALYDFHDFTPELVVINLGTNDSRFLGDPSIQQKFVICYIDFLKFIRSKYPDCKILCICGTLCTESYPFVEKACNLITNEGYENIYAMELPFHNVLEDGQASEHPSAATHAKDAKRLIAKIKEIMPELDQ